MKKKVALVICYRQQNYGSQLQSYATQFVFDKLDIPNETIRMDELRKDFKIWKLKCLYYIRHAFDWDTICYKVEFLRYAAVYRIDGKLRSQLFLRRSAFKDFAKSFRLSPPYRSMEELKVRTSDYVAFVVGSDQLWFPSNVAARYWTLEFVPDDIPKISLSTSFGVARIRESQKEHVASFLKRLNHISVREVSGQQIVKDLTGRDVPVTADPTLLLTVNEWSAMQKQERIIAEKYIFCYFLGNNPEHRAFAKKMRAKTGMKIVQLQHLDCYIPSDNHFPDSAPYNISSPDFISLIRDAEYVLTDSFHGTVFSLLYRKSFFCFRRYRESSTVSTNNRLYSLLSRVGMESHLLRGDEPIDDCLKITGDFEYVHAVISEWRTSTFDYLTRALNESGIDYDKYYE